MQALSKRPGIIILSALLTGAGVGWMATGQSGPKAEPAKAQTVVAGSVVVRDQETGELRAPTAQEWAELGLDRPSLRDRQPAPFEVERRPDGTLSVITANLGADYVVASIAEDGSLLTNCRKSGAPVDSAARATHER